MKKTWKIALIVLLVLALAAGMYGVYRHFSKTPEAGAKTITVEINHLDGSKQEKKISTDAEYLRGALEEAKLAEGRESDYGLYVLTMDGETADEAQQQWWGFTKDGAYVETSVDQTPIADGEHYEFTLNVGW